MDIYQLDYIFTNPRRAKAGYTWQRSQPCRAGRRRNWRSG